MRSRMNRLSTDNRARVLACLVEGASIRSTVRITGICKRTVSRLVIELGANETTKNKAAIGAAQHESATHAECNMKNPKKENTARSNRADKAIRAYMRRRKIVSEVGQDMLTDLLTDLRHWAERRPEVDYMNADNTSQWHFENEIASEREADKPKSKRNDRHTGHHVIKTTRPYSIV